MGAMHFLTIGMERVKTEMSLHVLAYNFKRLMKLLDLAGIMEAVRAYALILDLPRLFGLLSLVVGHRIQKTESALLTSRQPATRPQPRAVRQTAAIFEFLHSLGRLRPFT